MSLATPVAFILDLNSLIEVGVSNKEDGISTSNHECTLFVGDGVAVDTYVNQMTVGVGKALSTQ